MRGAANTSYARDSGAFAAGCVIMRRRPPAGTVSPRAFSDDLNGRARSRIERPTRAINGKLGAA
jgi:hypothetical protein